MRGYSVVVAALALGVDLKWLDNLLSQNSVSGVSQSRQGIPRRLAPGALHVIATVHSLNRELHIPVATALRLAHSLWQGPRNPEPDDAAELQVANITVRVTRSDVRARVDAALAEALEMSPRPKRGRPRRKDANRNQPEIGIGSRGG